MLRAWSTERWLTHTIGKETHNGQSRQTTQRTEKTEAAAETSSCNARIKIPPLFGGADGIRGGHCKNCPINDTCLPDTAQDRARFVYRGLHQDEIEAVRRRQQSKKFARRLIERKWKIEGILGEAKVNHALRRARYRGLPKVEIQFFMIAIALNCKRAILGRLGYLLRLLLLLTLDRKVLALKKTIFCGTGNATEKTLARALTFAV